jgi:hypothetical protein
MRSRILAFTLLIAVTVVPKLAAKERKAGPPELHRLYATAFANFSMPDLARMKGGAIVIGLRPAGKAWTWQCVLRVLMQRGPVIGLDLEHGLIAAPPLIAQFEKDKEQLRLAFLEELYRVQGGREYVSGFDLLSVQSLLKEVAGQVSVQCEGDIRLSERWKYLRASDH